MGFQDEVWWSRVTQPTVRAWTDKDEVLSLVEQTRAKDDPDPKALACYGLLVAWPAAVDTLPQQVWLRFVEHRPVSPLTTQYLAWCCAKLEKVGKTALILIWDNASWHISKEVRSWIKAAINRSGGKDRGCESFPATCPAKVPGSIALSPTGCTLSARLSNPLACSRLKKSPIGSVPTLLATICLSLRSPKRCPDSALVPILSNKKAPPPHADEAAVSRLRIANKQVAHLFD